ncbi:MAG: transcriptional repressor LexA [Chthonomonadales bacterium]
MTRGLTDKQERILNFIVEYVEDKGYPPSIREIGTIFDISSLRGVTVHLDALERKGYIKRANTSRSITVMGRTGSTSPKHNITMLPLVGTIAAGMPILAAENVEEQVPVPTSMVHNAPGAFLLRVKGDSMIDAHIMEDDLVVIRPQAAAEHGDLVAAMIEDEATIKWFDTKDGKTRLIPANVNYHPIDFNRDDARVIGKVIGLLRSFGSRVV